MTEAVLSRPMSCCFVVVLDDEDEAGDDNLNLSDCSDARGEAADCTSGGRSLKEGVNLFKV